MAASWIRSCEEQNKLKGYPPGWKTAWSKLLKNTCIKPLHLASPLRTEILGDATGTSQRRSRSKRRHRQPPDHANSKIQGITVDAETTTEDAGTEKNMRMMNTLAAMLRMPLWAWEAKRTQVQRHPVSGAMPAETWPLATASFRAEVNRMRFATPLA